MENDRTTVIILLSYNVLPIQIIHSNTMFDNNYALRNLNKHIKFEQAMITLQEMTVFNSFYGSKLVCFYNNI